MVKSDDETLTAVNAHIAIMSRIRLARNLRDIKFSHVADDGELSEISKRCSTALSKVPRFKNGSFYDIGAISDFEKSMLLEDRLVSKELVEGGDNRSVYVSVDRSSSAMINEEDHLRLQAFSKGLCLGLLWRKINSIDDAVESRLEFAFSPRYGYLTACPTNVGTGMRASVMMHLPALTFSEQMDKVVRGVNQLGMVVRGANGEGSDSFGSIFQLSNQQTLGMSESEIVKKITKFCKLISGFEINARNKLMQDNPLFIPDKIARAHAVLVNCKLIDSVEATVCLSNLRLGADMGLIRGGDELIGEIDEMFAGIQPAHLQTVYSRFDASAADRDRMRSDFLRSKISRIVGRKPLSI